MAFEYESLAGGPNHQRIVEILERGGRSFPALAKQLYDLAAREEPFIPPEPAYVSVSNMSAAGLLHHRFWGRLELDPSATPPISIGAPAVAEGGTPVSWYVPRPTVELQNPA